MAKSLHILFIDDSSKERLLFRHILSEIDPTIQCMVINSGQEAIDYLYSATILPDYIFLDINMPEMDGIECLSIIKRNQHLSSIPVFMYSTGDRQQYEDVTRALGAQFLSKETDFFKSIQQISSILLPVRDNSR